MAAEKKQMYMDMQEYIALYPLAALGYPQAQYELATSLIDKEKEEYAIPWLMKAAAQGHPKAQYDLGLYYAAGSNRPEIMRAILEQLGAGDEKSLKKGAINLFEMAAQQGHVQACRQLIHHYTEKEPNIDKMFQYYKKSLMTELNYNLTRDLIEIAHTQPALTEKIAQLFADVLKEKNLNVDLDPDPDAKSSTSSVYEMFIDVVESFYKTLKNNKLSDVKDEKEKMSIVLEKSGFFEAIKSKRNGGITTVSFSDNEKSAPRVCESAPRVKAPGG